MEDIEEIIDPKLMSVFNVRGLLNAIKRNSYSMEGMPEELK